MQKIKKYITVLIFIAFIFVVGILSAVNLLSVHKEGKVQPANSPSGFENDFKSNLYLKTDIIEAHGLTQRLIGNDVVEDAELGSIVKTNWGQLTSLPGKNELEGFRNNLRTITKACRDNEIPAVYLQAPFKVLPSFERVELPTGLSTFANENVDSVISMLEAEDVDVFDLRSVLEKNDKIPQRELFFNTDHHWRIETAYYAFCRTLQYFCEKYDYCSETLYRFLTDENNFRRITMENCYLGSWGRRTGATYAGLDDFTYLIPDFDTDISIKRIAGDAHYEATGDFYNVVMSPKRVEKEQYGPSEEELAAGYGNGIYTDLYSVYMDGYTAEMQIVNNSVDSEKRILIFHDSFGFPFSSFMSLSAKETRVIDLRNWHEDIGEYISAYNPDMVLMIYNPDQ